MGMAVLIDANHGTGQEMVVKDKEEVAGAVLTTGIATYGWTPGNNPETFCLLDSFDSNESVKANTEVGTGSPLVRVPMVVIDGDGSMMASMTSYGWTKGNNPSIFEPLEHNERLPDNDCRDPLPLTTEITQTNSTVEQRNVLSDNHQESEAVLGGSIETHIDLPAEVSLELPIVARGWKSGNNLIEITATEIVRVEDPHVQTAVDGAELVIKSQVLAKEMATTVSTASGDQAPSTPEQTVVAVVEPVVSTPVSVPPCRQPSPVREVTPEAKRGWMALFGVPFEDEAVVTSINQTSPTTRPPQTTPSTSLLRNKLERERRLDQQIQTRRQQYRDRVMAAPSPAQANPSSRRRCHSPRALPFLSAGLTPTSIRFCLERALDRTTQCFQHLHAIAQGDVISPTTTWTLGVFLPQWEMDAVLDHLFRPAKTSTHTFALLTLSNTDYALLPLETLLQVSWILPLDQLSALRHIVATESTRQPYLNEHQLILLNTTLRAQLLVPQLIHSRAVQQVVLQIVQTLQQPARSQTKIETTEVPALLHVLHVPLTIEPTAPCLQTSVFLALSPVELAKELQLSSVLMLQRIVLIRFVIDNVYHILQQQDRETKRQKEHYKQRQKVQEEDETRVKTTKRMPIRKRRNKATRTDPRNHNSLTMVTGRVEHESSPSCTPLISMAEEADIQTWKAELALTLDVMTSAMPWLRQNDNNNTTKAAPATAAIRATYLAAQAFQQSLDLLLPPQQPALSTTFHGFLEALHTILRQLSEPLHPTTPHRSPNRTIKPVTTPRTPLSIRKRQLPPPQQLQDDPVFPPPYEEQSKAAYWVFEPDLPSLSTPTPSRQQQQAQDEGDAHRFRRRPRALSWKKLNSPVPPAIADTVVTNSEHVAVDLPSPDNPPKEEEPATEDAELEQASQQQYRRGMEEMVRSLLVPPPREWITHAQAAATTKTFGRHRPVPSTKSSWSFVERMRQQLIQPPSKTEEQATLQMEKSTTARIRTETTKPKKIRPQPSPANNKTAVLLPPPSDNDPLANDEQLTWAARVSAFYKSKLNSSSLAT